MSKMKMGTRVLDNTGDAATITGKRKGARQLDYDNPDFARNVWLPKDWLTVLAEEVAATETTFSVGDRVRMRKDSPWYCADTETVGTLVEPDEGTNRPYAAIFDGDKFKWHLEASELEPVVAPATWVPAVGDRVRVIDATGGGKVGDECVVTRVKPYSDGSGDTYCTLSGLTGGNEGLYSYRLTPLPVAPEAQPAGTAAGESGETLPPATTWSPVVGKFGKTRDGRKVGPMRESNDGVGTYAFRGVEHGGLGRDLWIPRSGAGVNHGWGHDTNLDLVAEWVEPAPATAPAIGSLVTLSAPARISGFDKRNAHIVLDTGGSFVLPIASLIAA